MQLKEVISRGNVFFRSLRKGNKKYKTDIKKEIGLSFPIIEKVLPELLNGPLKETPDGKLKINPEYQTYAGIYISNGTIELSVIDFSGKKIKTQKTKIFQFDSFYEALRGVICQESSVNAITICSDEYFDNSGNAKMNTFVFLDKKFMKDILPEGIECYFEKACVTSAYKWYDSTENDGLNIVFSFSDKNCYYTIMKNGIVIQKIRCLNISRNPQLFYEEVLLPICKSINPDNIVFSTSSEDDFTLIKDNLFDWTTRIRLADLSFNQGFEERKATKLIALSQINPSETAALHAMYMYNGWI